MARNKTEYDKAKVERGRRGEAGGVSNRKESTTAMNSVTRGWRGNARLLFVRSFVCSFRTRTRGPWHASFRKITARIDRFYPRIMMRIVLISFSCDTQVEEGERGARSADADGHAWMFHEDTADRRKGDVITNGQFCALRISALDRSKSRGVTRQVGQRDWADRSDSSPLYAQPKTSPVCNVVAKIFMPAGHSCVIEFEHISAALPPLFALSFTISLSFLLSMRQFIPQFQVVAGNADGRQGILEATATLTSNNHFAMIVL